MRFPFPRNRHRHITALDFSCSEIRLVTLSTPRRHAPQLEAYACERLTPGIISDDGIEEPQQLIEAVRRLLQASANTSRHIAIGIPSALTITSIHPLATDSQIDDDTQLQAQARDLAAPLLPYPVEIAALDFRVIPPSASQAGPRLFIAATQQDIVGDLLAMSEALNLDAATIDISAYAAHHAWQCLQAASDAHGSKEITAFIRASATAIECALFANALLIDCQVEAITSQRQHFRNENATSSARCANAAAALLQSSLTKNQKHVAQRIVLSGNISGHSDWLTAMRRYAQDEVILAAPFARLRHAASLDATSLAADAPAYLAACGLALRGLEQDKQ